jgi:PKD repeat protein
MWWKGCATTVRMAACAALVALAGSGCEELPPAPDVPNDPPAATFFFTPVAPIYAGQTAVTFSAVGARDRDGSIVSYRWSFGDGSDDRTTSTPVTEHTFRDTGARCMTVTYGVLLTVIDDRGGEGFASNAVTVRQLPLPTAPECQGR